MHRELILSINPRKTSLPSSPSSSPNQSSIVNSASISSGLSPRIGFVESSRWIWNMNASAKKYFLYFFTLIIYAYFLQFFMYFTLFYTDFFTVFTKNFSDLILDFFCVFLQNLSFFFLFFNIYRFFFPLFCIEYKWAWIRRFRILLSVHSDIFCIPPSSRFRDRFWVCTILSGKGPSCKLCRDQRRLQTSLAVDCTNG